MANGLTVASFASVATATVGGGPSFHKAARTPLYPKDELDR
jgi:hypothetical protein